MRRHLIAALIAGVVAGTLDIGAAAAINRVGLDVVMRAIARGLLGKAAMTGRAPVAALGFGLQIAMSMLIAAIFAVAASRAPILAGRWLLSGLTYGAVIFLVMNYVVVPLSAVRTVPHFTTVKLVLNLVAMLGFGLIVAYAANRAAASG